MEQFESNNRRCIKCPKTEKIVLKVVKEQMDFFKNVKHYNFPKLPWCRCIASAFRSKKGLRFESPQSLLRLLLRNGKSPALVKQGGSERWQMIRIGLGLWWLMSFCLLIWSPSWINSISFSTHSGRMNRHRPADLGYSLEGRIGGWRERRRPRTGRSGPGRAQPGKLQHQYKHPLQNVIW